MDHFPSPQLLGLPKKFTEWRKFQPEAIQLALDSPKRFVCLSVPVGGGKSATAIGIALMAGGRTAVLTSSRALQDQYLGDFSKIGMVDVRGMSSYKCLAAPNFGLDPNLTVEQGICHSNVKCVLKSNGCLYYDQVYKATKSPLVITNYAFWMSAYAYRDGGIGKFDILICDEAHSSVEQLSSFLSVELNSYDIKNYLHRAVPRTDDMLKWRSWASASSHDLEVEIAELSKQIAEDHEEGIQPDQRDVKYIKELKAMSRKVDRLAHAKGKWVVERGEYTDKSKRKVKTTTLSPVWPAEYAQETLFRDVPKVILTSATVRPKTMELLGLKPDDYDFADYPSTFPVHRRRVFHIPTVRMNINTTDDELWQWVDRIDEIVDHHKHEKGILHAVSFKRSELILNNARNKDFMMGHTSATTRQEIEKFKKAKPPLLMVSPSLTTGFDFPLELCRYIIIGKVPFPDHRAPTMAARIAIDKDYSAYITAQTLVQSSGRGTRSESDGSKIYVLDDAFVGFYWKYKHFFPKWFCDAVVFWKNAQLPPVPNWN